MRSFLIFTFLILLVGCGTAGDLWPQNTYSYVVAYCYDHTKGDKGNQVLHADKTHHEGVISALTVRLSEDQTKKLKRLLLRPPKRGQDPKRCYTPHHGFVFYDKDWNPKAQVSICFECNNFSAEPKNIPERLDLEAIRKFVESIGLPVYGSANEYTKLYEKLEQ